MTWHRAISGMLLLLGFAAPAAAASQSAVALPVVRPEHDRIVAGLYAKVFCTATFVSHLPEEVITAQDLAGFPLLPVKVDRVAKRVIVQSADVQRLSVYHEGWGCTLAAPHAPLKAFFRESPRPYPQIEEADARHPDRLRVALSTVLEPLTRRAFREAHDQRIKNARALLVLQHGVILAESYSSTVTADTPLPGYSMAKGVLNLLLGRMARCGWLHTNDRDLTPQWRVRPHDLRASISVDDLRRMRSGLEWTESYDGSASDLMKMLTEVDSAGTYAAAKPLRKGVLPGQLWQYSGGSYEILSMVMHERLTEKKKPYWSFPYTQLFRKLGMTSALIESDPDGTYLLSAYVLATARDWARLGQFILNERLGHASGLLPAGWIEQSATPTTAGSDGPDYGAAFWLDSLGPGVPPDTFYLAGLQGQFLVVVPSMDLVVVRLASTPEDGNWSIKPVMTDVVQWLKTTPRVPQALAARTEGGANASDAGVSCE